MNSDTVELQMWWDKYSKDWRYYPHLIMVPSPEESGWRCDYCHELIPWDTNEDGTSNTEPFSCTERKQPCQWCGESPLCAPDCVGMRMLFSKPEVYVTGDNPFGRF